MSEGVLGQARGECRFLWLLSLIPSCQIFVSLSPRGIGQVVDVKLEASTSTSDA